MVPAVRTSGLLDTVARMVSRKCAAVTPSIAAKWYRLPRKCVSEKKEKKWQNVCGGKKNETKRKRHHVLLGWGWGEMEFEMGSTSGLFK